MRDQRLDVGDRQCRVGEQQQRRGRDLRDRGEILDHVERHAAVQPFVEHGGNIHEHQRAAVGRGLGDVIDADRAARAGSVLDHDRLLEPLRKLFGDGPANGVHAAAGRDRHHQRDRTRWIADRRLRLDKPGRPDKASAATSNTRYMDSIPPSFAA